MDLTEWQRCQKKYGTQKAMKKYNKKTKTCSGLKNPRKLTEWQKLVQKYGVSGAKERYKPGNRTRPPVIIEDDNEGPEMIEYEQPQMIEYKAEKLTDSEKLELTNLLTQLAWSTDDKKQKREIEKLLTMISTGGFTRGIIKRLGNLFGFLSVRTDFNNVSKKTLKHYGDCKIEALMVYRTPVPKVISGVLNVISLGKFNKIKNKVGYDDLFHIALVATVRCPDGRMKNIIIEKNEEVNISTKYRTTGDTQIMPVPIHGMDKNLNEFILKGLEVGGPDTFFRYDAFNLNCQDFIFLLLTVNRVINPQVREFVKQPMGEILQNTPSYVKKFARGITDIAAVFNKLIGGCNSCPKAQQTRDMIFDRFENPRGSGLKDIAKNTLKGLTIPASILLYYYLMSERTNPERYKGNFKPLTYKEMYGNGYDPANVMARKPFLDHINKNIDEEENDKEKLDKYVREMMKNAQNNLDD